MLGGAVLLDACGSSGSASPAPTKRPPIGKEPGTLSILEWGGYEAAGTKAQTYPAWKWARTTRPSSARAASPIPTSPTMTRRWTKAASSGPFDLMHPCHENLPDYVQRGLVQPWDTCLLPSFTQLNPYLVKAGPGQRQAVHDPLGLGLREPDLPHGHVDPADATGWELAWNTKYSGKISLWNGASTNFEVAALKLGYPKMDQPDDSQLAAAKAALHPAEAAEQALLEQASTARCSRTSSPARCGSPTRGRTRWSR